MKLKRIILCVLTFWQIGQPWAQIVKSKEYPVLRSSIQFTVENAKINVNGTFEKIESHLFFDKVQPEKSSFEASVFVESIQTKIKLRDKHLKGKSYFDAAQYPEISIKLLSAKHLSKNQYEGVFKVKIKNMEKDVSVPFTFLESLDQIVFSSQFVLNRLDFKVGGKSWTMSDFIQLKVEFVTSSSLKDYY